MTPHTAPVTPGMHCAAEVLRKLARIPAFRNMQGYAALEAAANAIERAALIQEGPHVCRTEQ